MSSYYNDASHIIIYIRVADFQPEHCARIITIVVVAYLLYDVTVVVEVIMIIIIR